MDIGNFNKKILVISGGGIKGFSALGAVSKLSQLNIMTNIETFCGTSAGSAICLLLIIGYSAQDIYNILSELDMNNVIKPNLENIFDDIHIGLNLSDPIIYIIGFLMKKKNYSIKTTFDDLFKKTNKHLIVTGVCLNDVSLHYFSYSNSPNMEILKAIQISISIPLIFKPCEFQHKLWIDGGVMNNYPIDLFNSNLNDVIGIYMDEDYDSCDSFEDTQSYIFQIIKCLFKGMNFNKINLYKEQTIHIKTKNLSFSFELSKNQMLELFNIGYSSASLFFNST